MTDFALSPQVVMEVRGRLLLWGSALAECQMYLKLLNRAEPELTSGRFDPDPAKAAAFQEFLNEQTDRIPGGVKISHINAFEALHPTVYPSFSACLLTTSACKLLLVVLFCQLLTQGNRDEGRVARNSKEFVSIHLRKVVEIALGPQGQEQFDEFCESCLAGRDKMIGHADGVAFSVSHGEFATSHKLVITAVEKVDFTYMASIVGPLQKAIYECALAIKP